jgi:hypothetical protein
MLRKTAPGYGGGLVSGDQPSRAACPHALDWQQQNDAGPYVRAELKTRAILEKHFPAFAEWCTKQGCDMFTD